MKTIELYKFLGKKILGKKISYFYQNLKLKKMRKSLILFKIVLGCSLFAIISCTNDDNSQKKTKDSLSTASDTLSAESKENVSYQIPSPEDLFALIKKSKLPYRETLLNATTGNYVTVLSKELNLGVFVADLSYSSIFNMNQNTLKYFTAVYKISESLGISSLVSNSFQDRMKKNLDNPDSLSLITSNSFYSIIQDLDNAGKGKTVAVVTTGGWVEGMYIVTNLIEKYDANDQTIQRLASQKGIFSNLSKNLEKYSSDKDVIEIQKDLEPIKEIFNQLQNQKQESSMNKAKDGKITLGSKEKTTFTEAQFNNFKQKIKDIRTKFVK